MRFNTMWFLMLMFSVVLMSGCGNNDNNDSGGAAPDVNVPFVISVVPAESSTNMAINMSIAATFSREMNPATITGTTFTVTDGTTPVAGVVTYTGFVAIFNPTGNLAINTVYHATITTGAKSTSGIAIAADKMWSFTTGTSIDTTAPTVSATTPLNGATGIPLNRNISAACSEMMDPTTITSTTFTLTDGTTPVAGTVSYLGHIATFNPTNNLAATTLYTATLTTGAADLAGNTLAADMIWTFTTGTTIAAGPMPVELGTAGDFVILTKAGIATTGATSITGNIGVSPAAATYITGFGLSADASNIFSTSSLVTGNVYAANYAVPTPYYLTTSVYNMEAAYVDAAGRAIPDFTEYAAGDISGLILVPGLYKWGTGVLINTDVTLDGSADDVWIFQIAGDITIGSGAKVMLAGGAQAKNVFWQSFGAVTLNTTSHLEGIVLTYTEITLATGATVHGRLLSQTAVTLDASTVTAP